MTMHNASIHGTPTHRAFIHRPAGHWPMENAAGSLTLDFDARHRRRIRLTGDQGEDVLLDLPQAVAMADGDGLQLEDGRWLKVQAAAGAHCRSQAQRSKPACSPRVAFGKSAFAD